MAFEIYDLTQQHLSQWPPLFLLSVLPKGNPSILYCIITIMHICQLDGSFRSNYSRCQHEAAPQNYAAVTSCSFKSDKCGFDLTSAETTQDSETPFS